MLLQAVCWYEPSVGLVRTYKSPKRISLISNTHGGCLGLASGNFVTIIELSKSQDAVAQWTELHEQVSALHLFQVIFLASIRIWNLNQSLQWGHMCADHDIWSIPDLASGYCDCAPWFSLFQSESLILQVHHMKKYNTQLSLTTDLLWVFVTCSLLYIDSNYLLHPDKRVLWQNLCLTVPASYFLLKTKLLLFASFLRMVAWVTTRWQLCLLQCLQEYHKS